MVIYMKSVLYYIRQRLYCLIIRLYIIVELAVATIVLRMTL